jgi:hypothetical protein
MKKSFVKFNTLALKYGVAALILVIPLYPKFPFISVPGTYVSIRLEDFLLLVVSIIWFISVLPQIPKILKDKFTLSILLFTCIGLVSLMSAIFVTHTVSASLAILHWARRIEYMVCFFIGLQAIKNKRDAGFFIRCFFIVILYIFIYGLGQKLLHWPIITTQNNEYSKGIALQFIAGGHLVSTFAGHYDLATFLVLIIPALVILLVTKPSGFEGFALGKSVRLVKIAVFLLTGCSLWLLVNTASRISIVSYFLAVTLALVLKRKLKYIPIFIIISLIFIATSSNLIARYTQIFDVYFHKIISSNYIVKSAHAEGVLGAPPIRRAAPTTTPTPAPPSIFEDRSTSIRLQVEWPRALRAFQKNPLLGTGFSSITLATDNDYLRVLGEAGLLGLGSFLLILWLVIKRFIDNRKIFSSNSVYSSFATAIFAAMAGVSINAFFIDVFEASKFAILLWLLLGFAVKMVELDAYEQK